MVHQKLNTKYVMYCVRFKHDRLKSVTKRCVAVVHSVVNYTLNRSCVGNNKYDVKKYNFYRRTTGEFFVAC